MIVGKRGNLYVYAEANRNKSRQDRASRRTRMAIHLFPAITETLTRLPPRAPLAASPEAAGLQAATGVLVTLFLIGATLQVRRLRGTRPLFAI